ncbi:glycosyltransferase family 2 protein [Candidatus Peregrinibacteria bacterium]|nr:glycosyltransferase family 2 protein [Candidatus Peregrinibacteria bacterium]
MTLSLILPCFNEEATIAQTVRSCIDWVAEKKIIGEIIVVNDGSTDRSGEILAALKSRFPLLRIVTHGVNQGYGVAVRSGCDAARMEWIAFMDSDGQFDVRDLEKFVGRESVIAGRRCRRADSMLRNVYGKGLGIVTWILFGVWVRDINCGMKLFKRELWSGIRPIYGIEKMFNTELFLRLKTMGVVWRQVDVRHFPRHGGHPTGASVKVIGRMFKELWKLRMNLSLIAAGQSSYCANNSRTEGPIAEEAIGSAQPDQGLVRSR